MDDEMLGDGDLDLLDEDLDNPNSNIEEEKTNVWIQLLSI